MSNVIYIGGVPPEDLQEKVRDWGSPTDFAGYTFQKACLKGLDYYFPDIKVLSTIFVVPYPLSRKYYLPTIHYSHKGESAPQHDVMMGMLNIVGLNLISKYLRLRKHLKATLSPSDDNVVVAYALFSPHLLAILSQRKKISKVCVIVPDLPEYMTSKKNVFYKMAKWIDRFLIDYAIKRFDCFVLLSKYMKDCLPIGDKPWTLYEGVYNHIEIGPVNKAKYKTILYTGNAGIRTGIINLIEAFEKIKSTDYRLWIRGNGDAEEYIREMTKKDKRISLIEPLSKKALLELQKQATVLVNPTSPAQEFTKYFFPSKTMEYLASGTPTLMYKLPCIPDEYDPYIYYIEDDSVDGIYNSLIDICEKPYRELEEFGQKASLFIKENKNPIKQAGKIVELLSSC